ncbi:MAG: extracellular solute-binding protein [Clostridiales bacterium]|jgi:ABC-type glycerol-3-phosphate transport system substrate-binding protein|nr:extracellular solute-binding protein [Clostridiales bacterium]
MRLKRTKAVLAALSAAVLVLSFGCKAEKPSDTQYDVEITFWESGHGSEFIKNIAAAFNDKYPEYKASVTLTTVAKAVPVNADALGDTTDLYMMVFPSYMGHTKSLEPLDDVVSHRPDGEGKKTIGEKIGATVLGSMSTDEGAAYALPYATAVTGIVYNQSVFTAKGYAVPRTSTELLNLAERMKEDGYVPFNYYMAYAQYLYSVWIAQMGGADAYFDIKQGTYTDADGVKSERDIRSFTDYAPGSPRYETLREARRLMSPAGYVLNGASTMTHTATQTYFLNGQGLMMFNGNWVENEMKSSPTNIEFRMMKIPVLSAIRAQCPSIESDRELSALIAAIDAGSGAPAGEGYDVSAEDYNRVAAARKVVYAETSQFSAFIPRYSNAIPAAKTFLKYYYSDEAMRVAAAANHMSVPVALSDGEIDTDGWSEFSKSCNALAENEYTPVFDIRRSPLNYRGGLGNLFYYHPTLYLTYSQNPADILSLSDFINKETLYWQQNWQTYMRNAGY